MENEHFANAKLDNERIKSTSISWKETKNDLIPMSSNRYYKRFCANVQKAVQQLVIPEDWETNVHFLSNKKIIAIYISLRTASFKISMTI